jgi:hydroxymethylglutaryl-CoA reductase
MCAQIQLLDVKNPNEDAKKIMDHKDALISFANTLCRNMCRRGGGVKDIRCRIIVWNPHSYLSVHDSNSINEPPSVLHYHKNHYPILQSNFNFDPDLNNSQCVNNHDKKNEQHDNGNNRDYMLIVHIYIDVCESMGANLANTIAEGLAPKLADLIGARVGEFFFTSSLESIERIRSC